MVRLGNISALDLTKRSIENIDFDSYDHTIVSFSGGKDSLAYILALKELNINITELAFYDTGIAFKGVKEYVEGISKKLQIPLFIWKGESFEDLVLKYGFPSSKTHMIARSHLKERAIRKILKNRKGKIAFFTGIRRQESNKRKKTAKFENKVSNRNVWFNPLLEWNKDDVLEIINKYDLELSPAYKHIHMSGDCLCGAYFNPVEREMIKIFDEDSYTQILDLEVKARKVRGVNDPYSRWGNAKDKDKCQNDLSAFVKTKKCSGVDICVGCDR